MQDTTLLNKTDLLPHLDYDKDLVMKSIQQIHPDMPVFEISAKSGAGFAAWIEWLKKEVHAKNS